MNFYTNLGWGNKQNICILLSICDDASSLAIMDWLGASLRCRLCSKNLAIGPDIITIIISFGNMKPIESSIFVGVLIHFLHFPYLQFLTKYIFKQNVMADLHPGLLVFKILFISTITFSMWEIYSTLCKTKKNIHVCRGPLSFRVYFVGSMYLNCSIDTPWIYSECALMMFYLHLGH